MKIGLLSDTHGYLDEKIYDYFSNCDEVWHAGDIGNKEILTDLERFKPLRAVYGNIDGKEIRTIFPEDLFFPCEGLQVWMTHIGGKPPRYTPRILKVLKGQAPDIFICGHSHILKIARDDRLNMLFLNPGAAGKQGFHKFRTIVRFTVTEKKITAMEAIELGKR
jgi:putative phosphoesterase